MSRKRGREGKLEKTLKNLIVDSQCVPQSSIVQPAACPPAISDDADLHSPVPKRFELETHEAGKLKPTSDCTDKGTFVETDGKSLLCNSSQCYSNITTMVNRSMESENLISMIQKAQQCNEAAFVIQLAQHLPLNFKSERVRLATAIINSTFHTTYTEVDVQCALHEADRCASQSKLFFGNSPPTDLLWNATEKMEEPVNMFLAPPVSQCLKCNNNIHMHHAPTVVAVFTTNGPLPAQKITLRCKNCSINYRYDQYGGDGGYYYYNDIRDYIAASNVCYIERELCESWVAACHHGWVSFECSAEIYNETMRETSNTNYINFQNYLQKNAGRSSAILDDTEKNQCIGELHRKRVANAFWNYQVQLEMKEQNMGDYLFKGPTAQESFMSDVDIKRAHSVYSHTKCTEDCKKRGCGKLWAIDGNWKLRYPICMYTSPKQVAAFSGGLEYVDACPNSPVTGMAFCEEHCDMLKQKGVPVGLREYIDFKRSNELPTLQNKKLSASECQGINDGIKKFEQTARAVDTSDLQVKETKTSCNKDTGEKGNLQRWTRGVWFSVSGGGHIHSWQPLYKSEGPAQVFFVTLLWLVAEFGNKSREFWKSITLSYDNMCHLNSLSVARQLLPLPGDLKHIWSDLNKVIDDLHIRNHKDPTCQQLYSTKTLREELPEANTIACEQTFAWLSRHKKILCAMPKVHFHFYLHRLIKRRNRYIEHCYLTGKKVLSPKIKNQMNTS